MILERFARREVVLSPPDARAYLPRAFAHTFTVSAALSALALLPALALTAANRRVHAPVARSPQAPVARSSAQPGR